MRVYRRQEFLKLPAGTFFCMGTPWNLGGLMIKDQTTRNDDFFVARLNMVDANDSGEMFDRLEEMLKARG